MLISAGSDTNSCTLEKGNASQPSTQIMNKVASERLQSTFLHRHAGDKLKLLPSYSILESSASVSLLPDEACHRPQLPNASSQGWLCLKPPLLPRGQKAFQMLFSSKISLKTYL